MDWVSWKKTGWELAKKYRYVLLVILAGLLLLLLPEGEPEAQAQTQTVTQPAEPDLEESLTQILSQISGAGKVQVLLTQAAGEKILYQTDEDRTVGDTSTETHSDTVLLSGSGQESGLIQQVLPPVYRGAIVICQGADNANVTLSIVKAVMSVTGLRSDCITVLKMK